jgi:hypothetical protein
VTAHLDACADEDPAVFAAALRQLFPPAADPDPDLAAAGGEASRRFDLEALREAGPVSIRVPGSGWASVHIDLERGAVRLLKQREKGEEVIDTEVAPWAAFRLRRHTTLHRGHAVGDPTYDVIVLAGGRHSTVCGLSDSESLSPEVLRDRTGLPVTDPAPADRHVVRNMILGCFDHEEVQIHGCTGWVTDLDGGHRFLGTQGSITASGLDVEVAARVAGTAENEFAANHGWPIVASETDPAPALRDVVAAVQKVTPGRPEVGLALLAAPFAALLEGDGVVVGLEAAPGVGKTLIAQVPSAFTSFDPERSVDGKGAHVVLTSNKLTVKAVEVRQAALRGITMHCDDLKVSGDKARDTRSREIAGSMVEAYFGGGGGDEMRLNSGAEMRQSAGLEASGAGVLTGETMEVLSPSTRDRVIVLQMRRGDVDTVAGGGVDRWHTLVRRGAPQAVHLAVTRWVAEQLDAGSNGFFARETGVVGVGGMRAWVRRHRSAGTITREVVKAAVLEAGLRLLMAWEAACVPEGARVLDDDLVGSTMRSIAAQSAAAAQEATLAQQVVRGLRDALESGTGYLTRSQDEGVPVEPRMLGWAWADGPGANWVSRGRSLGRASYDYRNVLVTFDALRRVLAGSPLAEKTPAEIRRAMAEVAVNARNGDVPERLHTADLHLVFGPDARAPQVRGVVLPASLLGLGHIAQLAAELDEAAVKEVH